MFMNLNIKIQILVYDGINYILWGLWRTHVSANQAQYVTIIDFLP